MSTFFEYLQNWYLPTSSCQSSLWTPPNLIRYINTFFDLYIPNTLIQNLTTFFISFFITVIFTICSKLTFMLLFCEYSHSKLIDLLKTFTVTYLSTWHLNQIFSLISSCIPTHNILTRDHPRFFDQVGHQTASIGNKHFFY